jgi:hypothetical protein
MKRMFVYLIFALVAFLIFIPVSISSYIDYRIYTKWDIISVEITSLDLNYINFRVGDKNYFKRVKNATRYWSVGETARLKYLKGYEDHCLFANENPIPVDVIVLVMFLFCGIYFLRFTFKKDAPPVKAFGVQIGK